jgi:hypothetical protein
MIFGDVFQPERQARKLETGCKIKKIQGKKEKYAGDNILP